MKKLILALIAIAVFIIAIPFGIVSFSALWLVIAVAIKIIVGLVVVLIFGFAGLLSLAVILLGFFIIAFLAIAAIAIMFGYPFVMSSGLWPWSNKEEAGEEYEDAV